jgi:hypothetical protein
MIPNAQLQRVQRWATAFSMSGLQLCADDIDLVVAAPIHRSGADRRGAMRERCTQPLLNEMMRR